MTSTDRNCNFSVSIQQLIYCKTTLNMKDGKILHSYRGVIDNFICCSSKDSQVDKRLPVPIRMLLHPPAQHKTPGHESGPVPPAPAAGPVTLPAPALHHAGTRSCCHPCGQPGTEGSGQRQVDQGLR